jgi:uncharacterized membrane protein
MRQTIPGSTRSLPVVLGVTLVVGVLVGLAWGSLGVVGLIFGALYLVAIALFLVPGQRQITITDELVEVRKTAKARPEAQVTHGALQLVKRGPLFTWWNVADRKYCTPTPRATPLLALVDGQG